MIDVRIATSVDVDLVAAVTRLLPQLSTSAPVPTLALLQQMVDNPATTLFVADADGGIVGMLTLVAFPLPSGSRAWIEDVVVDDAARGQGVAAALVAAALAQAEALGARTVDLTSRPDRQAANRLYLRLGFEPRITNVYRYPLT